MPDTDFILVSKRRQGDRGIGRALVQYIAPADDTAHWSAFAAEAIADDGVYLKIERGTLHED